MYRIIIDTETTTTPRLVYDLGYIVVNEEGHIIKSRSYLIKEVYDDKPLFDSAYYADKRGIYETYLNTRQAKKVNLGFALYQLMKDMLDYDAQAYAYNSSFDNKVIKDTAQHFKQQKRVKGLNIQDIMVEAINHIVKTDDFREWCETYGLMTKHKRPRPKYGAETVYKYLTQNPDFVEAHTALEDSKIESVILLEVLKRARE